MNFVIVVDVGVLWELPQWATPRPDGGDRSTAELPAEMLNQSNAATACLESLGMTALS